ncbi:unnamed protein product [Enterobius vermicularis]|uniref:Protein sleepless n=1 Tax=Enterobius vermicularis TaxID=51028 RepID=A0A0N4V164_ENTVE|nr:unnamed protein product [Enterobius vermicularis]
MKLLKYRLRFKIAKNPTLLVLQISNPTPLFSALENICALKWIQFKIVIDALLATSDIPDVTEPLLTQRCVGNDFQLVDSCGRNIDEWSEVCACEGDRCNTYASFRSMIDHFNEISADVHRNYRDTVREIRRSQSSTLIILLVILPLSVGGLAVCLIFVNYHCKMC